jgi:hypothetical protein
MNSPAAAHQKPRYKSVNLAHSVKVERSFRSHMNFPAELRRPPKSWTLLVLLLLVGERDLLPA